MKNTKKEREKIFLRTMFFVIIISVLCSCGTQSKLYQLYTNSYYDVDVSLFISHSDSTYIYIHSLHSANIDFKEIGRVKFNKDTIILIPACEISSDTSFYMCRFYDCTKSGYSNNEELDLSGKCISKRVYIKSGNSITDRTLDVYYPNDSSRFSFYEDFPLYEIKIKQTKDEKSLLHGRDKIDRIF